MICLGIFYVNKTGNYDGITLLKIQYHPHPYTRMLLFFSDVIPLKTCRKQTVR